MTYSFGVEIETSEVSITRVRNALDRAGIRGCKVVPDGSPRVDAEIVLPPLALCQVSFEYLQSVCNVLELVGCRINAACGLHVHIGNAQVACGPAEFTGNSIAHMEETGRYYSNHGETFDAVIVKDIMMRYQRQQAAINTMLAASRTNNRFAMPLSVASINRANTISELNHGKYFAINLDTWSRGTIEFRQHGGTIEAEKIWKWVQFLVNFVNHTVEERVEGGTRTIVTDTPEQPFRRGARVGVQYAMMRTESGATTQEIMDATGCSEQRVRAAVSEIRTRVGDAAVVTGTQQSNGASYGDGTAHTSYRVPLEFETTTDGATLRDDESIGIPSIWAGTSDELFEWWQDRIEALVR